MFFLKSIQFVEKLFRDKTFLSCFNECYCTGNFCYFTNSYQDNSRHENKLQINAQHSITMLFQINKQQRLKFNVTYDKTFL